MIRILTGDVITLNQDNELLHIKDGGLAWEGNRILAVGNEAWLLKRFSQAEVLDRKGQLILPGFIDCHLHFPQVEIIGSYGEELLGWLNRYTFPTETTFSDKNKAARIANLLVDQLVLNGTTCSVLFSSSHLGATQTLFETLQTRGYRAIVGKVAMDQNCPNELSVPPDKEEEQTRQLIEQFHTEEGLLQYALTPRFAPTSSKALLEVMQKLRKDYPDIFVQTHYAENQGEIAWVSELFPERKSYLDVYDHYGLLGPKTLLAHSIHVEKEDLKKLQQTHTKIIHCPTSNLFLGSGLFPLADYRERNIAVALGTDVGAGTSFSLWQTMASAYGIQKVQGKNISPKELFALATLEGARALGKENTLGTLETGKRCDVQVIDPSNHPLLRERMRHNLSAEEILFALSTLGDDRLHEMTLIDGKIVYSKKSPTKLDLAQM